MSDSPEPRLLDHSYDGIQEYDNPMPRWWSLTLFGSVLFCLPYFYYYSFGVGSTLQDSYDAETAAFFEVMAKQLGDIKPDEQTLLRLSADAKFMTTGRVIFRSNCATCHAQDGGGGTGPNLTDDAFLHAKKVEDIYKVIHDGVVNKGMPEWGRTFGEPQLVVLAAYVASLRGTTPSSGKAPQGDVIAPWPAFTETEARDK